MKQFLGVDQYGHSYFIDNPDPKAWLKDHFGIKKISKMYTDLVSGGSAHVGYIINDLWIRLYNVTPFNGPA